MSTVIDGSSLQSDIDRCRELQLFFHDLQNGMDPFPPEHLATRLKLLDELDAIIGDLDPGGLHTRLNPELMARAKALSSQLEAANDLVYKAVRAEIVVHGNSGTMNHCLMQLVSAGDTDKPRPGLSFDSLDEFVSGVLQLRGPGGGTLLPSPEMTAYQPTPVRHILDLIAACNFSRDDILVDLGAGLGHVPLLVSILAGIRTLGVEVQPEYVASAERTARELNLSRVAFTAEEARSADLSSGTVFYMFSPFSGSILTDVLCRLYRQSRQRPMKVYSLGPCTRVLQDQPWLTASGRPDTERIAGFKSL